MENSCIFKHFTLPCFLYDNTVGGLSRGVDTAVGGLVFLPPRATARLNSESVLPVPRDPMGVHQFFDPGFRC